jgi:hypothetical protein
VDELTGPATEMPGTAGAWSPDGVFFYAKGLEIRQATPRGGAASGA